MLATEWGWVQAAGSMVPPKAGLEEVEIRDTKRHLEPTHELHLASASGCVRNRVFLWAVHPFVDLSKDK